MKFSEVVRAMRDFNEKHGITRKVDTKYKEDGSLIHMTAKVVISNSVLKQEYPLEQRTYTFSNYNKALTSSDLGYSIFAYCEADDSQERLENWNDSEFDSVEIIEIVE